MGEAMWITARKPFDNKQQGDPLERLCRDRACETQSAESSAKFFELPVRHPELSSPGKNPGKANEMKSEKHLEDREPS
jgi:hypothetical protein